MAKMVSLKRPKSESGKEGTLTTGADPGDDGVSVHLDHHHLTKLGVGGNLKHGDKVEFTGRGHVERSDNATDQDGERYSAVLRLHRGSLDHEPDAADERDDLRSELSRNHEKSESAANARAERKASAKA